MKTYPIDLLIDK